jgi:hypothetical protein
VARAVFSAPEAESPKPSASVNFVASPGSVFSGISPVWSTLPSVAVS